MLTGRPTVGSRHAEAVKTISLFGKLPLEEGSQVLAGNLCGAEQSSSAEERLTDSAVGEGLSAFQGTTGEKQPSVNGRDGPGKNRRCGDGRESRGVLQGGGSRVAGNRPADTESKGFTRWTGVSIMKHPGTQSNEFWG